MKKLPYRARTGMGDVFDIDFPLHGETGDPVRVGQIVSAVLDAVDKDVAIAGETSNGDVLQALAMAMAVRAGIIHAPHDTVARLSHQLLGTALNALDESVRQMPQSGRA